MWERCKWYDPEKGKPQELGGRNKSKICESCQRAGFIEKDVSDTAAGQSAIPDPERLYRERHQRELNTDKLTLFESSAAGALLRLQHDLIVELLKKGGPFWEAISELRTRWDITPCIGHPPTRAEHLPSPPALEEVSGEEWIEVASRWAKDVRSIVDQFFPERFRRARRRAVRRKSFVENCIFYDPPRDDFLGFAFSCGMGSPMQFPDGWQRDNKTAELVAMVEPPIERIRDADEVEAVYVVMYEELLRELGERYLKPLGLDIYALVQEISENTGLFGKHHDKLMLKRET